MTTYDSLRDSALAIIDGARREGLDCRLFGSLAVGGYLPKGDLQDRPAPIKDIDLIARSKDRRELQNLLTRLKWILDASLLLLAEKRETYYSTATGVTLDLYYDEIDGNHFLDFRDRLNLSYPALSPIDLLLTKLQRRSLRPEDTWDICRLLEIPEEKKDVLYFTGMLSGNWSLYTTVTDNLKSLTKDGCNSIRLLESAENAPKTLKWRFRSLVGRRLKWWKDVYGASVAIDR